MCACGLHAFYSADALVDSDFGEVWGAVLAWGRLELHSNGFRSQWQRPIALAEAPGTCGVRRAELVRAAAGYRVPVVSWEQLGPIAREHGNPIPFQAITVTPLTLLAESSAWSRAFQVEDFFLEDPDEDSVSPRELATAIARGSVLARHALAGHALDLAVRAAFESATGEEDLLRHLEVALIGLLSASEHWSAPEASDSMPEHHFRSYAAARIHEALASDHGEWGLRPISTLTWGRVRELTDAFSYKGVLSAPPARRPRSPLDEQQLSALLSILAERAQPSYELVSALWVCLHSIDPVLEKRCQWRVGLARRLFAAGSRATEIIRPLLFAEKRGRRREQQRAVARAIANDPSAPAAARTEALERLAIDGPIEARLRWLARPLADPWSASNTLREHTDGKAAAREILAHRPNTDAQLCACLAALGSEAAAAAKQRLESRPTPALPLLQLCIKALAPNEAVEIIGQRIAEGDAITNETWWAAISELPCRLRKQTARSLIRRLDKIPPTDRVERLSNALDTLPYNNPHDTRRALDRLIHAYLLDVDDIDPTDRDWLLSRLRTRAIARGGIASAPNGTQPTHP